MIPRCCLKTSKFFAICIMVKIKTFESLSMERIYGREGKFPSKPESPRDSVAIEVFGGCMRRGPVSWVCSGKRDHSTGWDLSTFSNSPVAGEL